MSRRCWEPCAPASGSDKGIAILVGTFLSTDLPQRRAPGGTGVSAWHPFAILVLLSSMFACILSKTKAASVAQLDRASDFGSEGYRFKSCRTRHFKRFRGCFRTNPSSSAVAANCLRPLLFFSNIPTVRAGSGSPGCDFAAFQSRPGLVVALPAAAVTRSHHISHVPKPSQPPTPKTALAAPSAS